MNIGQEAASQIFSLIAIAGGIYTFIKEEITVGGEDDSNNRFVTGTKAKILSILMIISGVVLIFDIVTGYTLLVGTMILGGIMSK